MWRSGGGVAAFAAGPETDKREGQPSGCPEGAHGNGQVIRPPSGRRGSARRTGQGRAKWPRAGGGCSRVEGRDARIVPRGTPRGQRQGWHGLKCRAAPLRCRNRHSRLCTFGVYPSAPDLRSVPCHHFFLAYSNSVRAYAAIFCLLVFFLLTVFPCMRDRRRARRLFLGLRSRSLITRPFFLDANGCCVAQCWNFAAVV